jgi:hypothetical protein
MRCRGYEALLMMTACEVAWLPHLECKTITGVESNVEAQRCN